MLELATDGKSPSFEYCANKWQATEATSVTVGFSGIENKLPNKNNNKNCIMAERKTKKSKLKRRQATNIVRSFLTDRALWEEDE